MQAIKWIYLTMFFNICFSLFSYSQTSILDPDKHLLIKNKIKKYEKDTQFYFNNSDTAEIWKSTSFLNDYGSILSISSVSASDSLKTVFEYVHDMLPASKSVFKNNSNIASSIVNYKYDTDYKLKEEIEFDSLDNLNYHKIYDKYGNIIEKIDYDGKEVTKRTTKNTYNEHGDILESTVISSNGTTEKVYFYKDGLLIREESTSNAEYTHFFIEYYVYNDNKQLISQHLRQKEYTKQYGIRYIVQRSTQYEYDHEGRLIKKRAIYNIKNPKDVDDNIGFSINDIIEGETRIITYKYNDMGLISNIFNTFNGKPFMVFNCKYFQ